MSLIHSYYCVTMILVRLEELSADVCLGIPMNEYEFQRITMISLCCY